AYRSRSPEEDRRDADTTLRRPGQTGEAIPGTGRAMGRGGVVNRIERISANLPLLDDPDAVDLVGKVEWVLGVVSRNERQGIGRRDPQGVNDDEFVNL